MSVKVEVSNVCCLCYGAKRALDNAIKKAKTRKNVVLFKEILHNKTTVNLLTKIGVKQKENLKDFTKDDFVIIRAHGEPKSTYEYFNSHNIEYLDCTCPNVMAINKLVEKKDLEGYKIILVGKYGYKTNVMHPEVKGTAGWCNNPIFIEEIDEINNFDYSFDKYFLVVQTTFSKSKAEDIISLLKEQMSRHNKIFEYKNTTCMAQKNINNSSVELAKRVNCMIVLGGKNSSNTKELYDNVSLYVTSFFAENLQDVKDLISLGKIKSNILIGLTAGASTTMEEVEEVKNYLEKNL